ncbi:MAG: hypothetical protein AAF750_15350 [Planctomycetota bacterium]
MTRLTLLPPAHRPVAPARGGFTTLEILVALGIFAFGFLAVAAIFPVGLLMQKQTTNSIIAGHVADNGLAVMQARFLEQVDMDASGTGADGYYANTWNNGTTTGTYPPSTTPFTVTPFENRVKALQWNVAARTGPPVIAAGTLIDRFGAGESLADRSHPSTDLTVSEREFFWVPLVKDPDGTPTAGSGEWLFYICVMQREPGVDYHTAKNVGGAFYADNTDSNTAAATDTFPTLRYVEPTNINGAIVTFPFDLGLIVGDILLDSEGIQYTVLVADGNTLTLSSPVSSEPEWFWYAPPGTGSGSPLLRIKTVLITLD